VPRIRVQFEGVGRDQLDDDLLDEAMERLRAVAAVDEVEMVVTDDLTASVRRRLPAQQADVFSADRVSGRVGAKTITTPAGCAIVIDGRLLVPGAAQAAGIDVPRFFEHESWHGALAHHLEDFDAAFRRLGIGGAQAHYVGQALMLTTTGSSGPCSSRAPLSTRATSPQRPRRSTAALLLSSTR